MNIVSLKYIFFITVAAGLYYFLKPKYRPVFLGLLSCGFIATYTYFGLIYVILFSLINYYLGLFLSHEKLGKLTFRIGLFFNILQLTLLRYATFAIDPFIHLLNEELYVSRIAEIIAPIGISYFTLQGIGYLINIKMGWEKPERSFMHFLLYISFFPKLLSGPIERSDHFLPQLKNKKTINEEGIALGGRQILMGFFKKIAVANQLAPYVWGIYGDVGNASDTSVWILFIIQPLYLYFDFSGYTDIAIGSAKLFGIDLLPNFNRPFLSKNMTNFWKRFHISLSSWFNDYVFKQVSFRLRRWRTFATIAGLLLTWILFGVWHGAGWTFMLLGLLQALVIIYEFFTKKWRSLVFSKLPDKISLWVGRVATYLFFCVALIFFFAPDLKSVSSFLDKLMNFDIKISFDGISTLPFMLIVYIPVLWVIELIQEDYGQFFMKLEKGWLAEGRRKYLRWTVYTVMITIMIIEGYKNQQFVYAHF